MHRLLAGVPLEDVKSFDQLLQEYAAYETEKDLHLANFEEVDLPLLPSHHSPDPRAVSRAKLGLPHDLPPFFCQNFLTVHLAFLKRCIFFGFLNSPPSPAFGRLSRGFNSATLTRLVFSSFLPVSSPFLPPIRLPPSHPPSSLPPSLPRCPLPPHVVVHHDQL